LNPEDYMTFNILFDGDPTGYTASFRMRGRFSLIQIPVTQRPDKPFITFPPFTAFWQNVALVFSSIGVVISLIVGIAAIIGTIRSIRRFRGSVDKARNILRSVVIEDETVGSQSAKKREIYDEMTYPLKYEFTQLVYDNDITLQQLINRITTRIDTARIQLTDVWTGAIGIMMLGVATAVCVVTLGGWLNLFVYQ
jgi:hypothetical protein